MFDYESQARKDGFPIVIGIDEAGRGPLAGPVVASAVALNTTQFLNKIADSKAISAGKREAAFHEIFQNGYVGIGIMSESAIDSVNILQATFCAMNAAVRQLVNHMAKLHGHNENFQREVCLLVDGNRFQSDLPLAYKTIVSGDSLCLSIACASIVAKVTRDRILNIYDKIFPQYGFCRHKGYPTQSHRLAISKYGLSPIHRRTFRSL